jgi:2-polyprenyl-3-methyl-5-hydroxy-6-metoxy-1,4-benzoquinol methylase
MKDNKVGYISNKKWECPMCSAVGDMVVYETASSHPKYNKHEIIKCSNCRSIYYAGDDPVLGYENEAMNTNYWLHYTQIGAGITAMLEPLFYLGERAKGSLLDVGCGFGYVVDFYNKIGYGKAIGLETAAYGKVGAKLLNTPIIHSYYAECNEIKGKKYDIIFSCEVLEHIPNPRSFINEISVGLGDDGVLVLTTPSSNVINSRSTDSEIIGSLSPDYHYFLASPEALENLLRSCGYNDVRVDDSGSRLYAWASRIKLPPLKKEMPWDDYFKYLEILSQNDDPNVRSGALQRLFKDSWNTGHVDVAASAYKKLEECALKNYALSFKYPDITRYNSRNSIVGDIDKLPAWYPSVLYFGAMYIGKIRKEAAQQITMLGAALQIMENEVSCLDPRLVQESQHLLAYVKNSLLLTCKEEENLHVDIGDQKINKNTIKRIITRIGADITWWKNNWKTRFQIK